MTGQNRPGGDEARAPIKKNVRRDLRASKKSDNQIHRYYYCTNSSWNSLSNRSLLFSAEDCYVNVKRYAKSTTRSVAKKVTIQDANVRD